MLNVSGDFLSKYKTLLIGELSRMPGLLGMLNEWHGFLLTRISLVFSATFSKVGVFSGFVWRLMSKNYKRVRGL